MNAKHLSGNTIQFSSVQDGIYVLWTVHMGSTTSLRSFPHRCLWNGSNVRLIADGPLSSFQGRSSSASSFHASLLQVTDVVLSLALCQQVVSQAPQHFRSSEKQTTCEGCYARQCTIRSFPFTQACPGQYTHRTFWCRPLTHSSLGFPFHFSLFVASSSSQVRYKNKIGR